MLNRSLSGSTRLYGWGSCLTLFSYLAPNMLNKVTYGFWLCKFCQCVTWCWVSITKMSLFACSDDVDVSFHDALVAEAGRVYKLPVLLIFRTFVVSVEISGDFL